LKFETACEVAKVLAAEVVLLVEGDLRRGVRADGDGGEAEQGFAIHGDVSLILVFRPHARRGGARAGKCPIPYARAVHRTRDQRWALV
jgi:hypothetical protein